MIGLFFLIVLLQYHMPRKFTWNPTFYHADKQPFGCYVFDSILSQTMPNGYEVTRKTFAQLDKAYPSRKFAVLMIEQDLNPLDISHLKNIAQRGGKVMVVRGGSVYNKWNGYIYLNELDSIFGINRELNSDFNLERIVRYQADDRDICDTIHWDSQRQVYPARKYVTFEGMVEATFSEDSVKTWSKLASVSYQRKPIAVAVSYGKGEVIFVATPLLFTNYGILDKNASEFVLRLMSQVADMPVYRTEAYIKTDEMMQQSSSPLRELLKRQPLRWALYLILLGVVLLMLTNSRRRQRVIPVISSPINKSLEFVKLIGTLYYQKSSRREVVYKKFLLFAEEVRRKCGIDLGEQNGDENEVALLAEKTGLDKSHLSQVLHEIRFVIHLEEDVTVMQMKRLIDQMNEILQKINI